jgi:hypothetical protein
MFAKRSAENGIMKIRIILALSVMTNVVLLTWQFQEISGTNTQPIGSLAEPVAATTAPEVPKTLSVAPFHWRQLESTNYPAYVANLRKIGCPEQTIRDIVSADVRAALQSAAGSRFTEEWGAWQRNADQLVDYLLNGSWPRRADRPAVETARQNANSSVASVPTPTVGGNSPKFTTLEPQSPTTAQRTPETNVTEEDPGTGREPGVSEETPELRAARRVELARQTSLNDFVRTHFGQDAFLQLEHEAAGTGTTLENHLANLQIAIPPFPALP